MYNRNINLLQYVLFCTQGDMSEHLSHMRSLSAYRWFNTRKIKAFYNNVCAPTFRIGVQVLLQVTSFVMLPCYELICWDTQWLPWKNRIPRENLKFFCINYFLKAHLSRSQVPTMWDLGLSNILNQSKKITVKSGCPQWNWLKMYSLN